MPGITYRELLRERGISLEPLGIKETALLREDALSALTLLREEGAQVLGGDVYFRSGDRIRIAYANWFSQRARGEGDEDFSRRSCEEARAYISAFEPPQGLTAIFTLVCK